MICVIEAELVADGERQVAELRWIKETDDGSSAVPGVQDGKWRVMVWGPWEMFRSDVPESV